MPEGPGRSVVTPSWTRVELYKYRPYAPGGSKAGFIAEYVYSFAATAWTALRARRQRPVRGAPGVQPAGHLLADRAGPAGPGPDPVRLRSPRPVPGAVPVPVPGRPEAALPGPAGPGAPDPPDGRPRDLHQRLLPGDRHPAQRQVRRPTSRSCGPAPTRTSCSAARKTRSCAGAAGTWPPTSASWGRRTASTSCCGPPTSSCTSSAATDIAFTLIGKGDCFDELVALRDELDLAGHVEFTGRAPDELVGRVMSTADVGPVARPEESAERRVDHEQDHGVHGLRAARASPSTCARRASRRTMPGSTSRPTTWSEYATRAGGPHGRRAAARPARQARAGFASSRTWRGAISGRAYLDVYRRLPGADPDH